MRFLRQIPNLRTLLRGHFLTGLMVVLPLAVAAWILGAGIGVLWRVPEFLPEAWQPENLPQDPRLGPPVDNGFPNAFTFILVILISLVGWASKLFLGREALE